MAHRKQGRTQQDRRKGSNSHRDPITGERGAHPLGVGLGTAAAATAGAVAGSPGGPVAALVGAAVGGVLGGLAGKGAAEALNPTAEDVYWRREYSKRPYAAAGRPYDDYRPAYRHGWEGVGRYRELDWVEAEPRLRKDWEKGPHASSLDWEEASPAARDAWNRIRTGADYVDDNR